MRCLREVREVKEIREFREAQRWGGGMGLCGFLLFAFLQNPIKSKKQKRDNN